MPSRSRTEHVSEVFFCIFRIRVDIVDVNLCDKAAETSELLGFSLFGRSCTYYMYRNRIVSFILHRLAYVCGCIRRREFDYFDLKQLGRYADVGRRLCVRRTRSVHVLCGVKIWNFTPSRGGRKRRRKYVKNFDIVIAGKVASSSLLRGERNTISDQLSSETSLRRLNIDR